MEIQEQSVFVVDGKKFKSKVEAIAYSRSKEFEGVAQEFADAMGYEGRVASRAKNLITKFLAWDANVNE